MVAVPGLSSDVEPLLVSVLVLAVALAHVVPHVLPSSIGPSRQRLLSAAGGISIVYAFVHLFPELDERRASIDGLDLGAVVLAEHHIFAIAFVGLALFYGLERMATVFGSSGVDNSDGTVATEPVFWIHVGAFAVYNAVIGYALVAGETGTENVILFAIAMGVHLLGNDTALADHHRETYHRFGRWILAGAVLVGAGVGVTYTIDDSVFTILLGLLTGAIVFNSIKDELPRRRESRFWVFAAGSAGYAVILFLI